MSKKLERVYHALVDGAAEGLADEELYRYVTEQCPKASSKRVVKASLLALSDPHLTDRNILNVIYTLAIKYRLHNLGVEDDEEDDEDHKPDVPQITETARTRLKRSTADIATVAQA